MKSPRRLIAVLLALVLALGTATPAQAQEPVHDAQHWYQTFLHYLGRVIEIAQKYVQIANEYTMIYNQYQQLYYDALALAKLDTYWQRGVTSTMDSMELVLAQSELPTHVQEEIRTIFDELYPGWQLPSDWWEEEREAVTSTLGTLRETQAAKQLEHTTTLEQMHALNQLKNQVREVDGTQKALEVLAGIAAFHAEATVLATVGDRTSADAATSYYAYLVNQLARQERALQEAIESSSRVPPELAATPGWGPLPSWWPY
ncbi:MAG TPA: hypothetical protein VF017_23635 [Thermoanaerobaculia bacterium]|nr:hypothetical protein [Thermoanaerobaculia bacterium]